VWRKKIRDNIEIASRSAQFLCVFSFEDVKKKRVKRQENSVAIFCVLTKIGHQQQQKKKKMLKDKNRILWKKKIFFFFFWSVCNPHCVL
jgi:hypothetical protein